MKIVDRIEDHYQQRLPFVAFRKPNTNELAAYFCSSGKLAITSSFAEEGFVFAPFDDDQQSVIFRSENSELIKENIPELQESGSKTIYTSLDHSEEDHKELVNSGIQAIEAGLFRKVVLSRKQVLKVGQLNFLKVFKRLLNNYKNAFVYLWYHPEIGMWFGATPERLVSLKNNQFITMALAGTQLFKGVDNPIWGEKEQKEHQYVVDYIVSQIKDPTNGIILKDFEVSETYTSKAGNLLHLKADITGEIGDFNLKELLNTLHPTPAVCGLPKEEAKKFILNKESYNRSYYSGFLGEINKNNSTELFVNLRCAEYSNEHLNIYVGGGVTRDSEAQKEYEETIAKTQTILKVL